MARDKGGKIRNRSFGTTMGVTSVIAILVILVLVVFSALSLITAKADLNLSQKTANNIKEYYEADSEGERILSQVSDSIRRGSQNNSGYNLENTGNGQLLKFTIPINESKNLNAEVMFDNRGNITEKRLWQVTPAKEWEKEDNLQLIIP